MSTILFLMLIGVEVYCVTSNFRASKITGVVNLFSKHDDGGAKENRFGESF